MADRAVQIVKFNKQSREFEFDKPLLESILMKEGVRDCFISIISITGAIRKGKSFMLSFLLRYLKETYDNNNLTNWLGDDETALSGFSWRGGSERHTTGIWIWSKIFTKALPNGEKVGVMLMDTQGTFDNNTTMKDNVTIFSLSTMVSSVQIYNLFNNIQQDDLEHLQLFTEYGKLAKEATPQQKPFQELLFLVRDWNFPYDLQYGMKGGNELLQYILDENDSSQSDEVRLIRSHIKTYFDKINCYLMPYPGKLVTHSENFQGQLKDIDNEFKDCLKDLCPSLLSVETLPIKKMYGHKIKANNFLLYFDTYFNVFKQGQLPTAQTVYNATLSAHITIEKEKVISYYINEMNSKVGPQHGFLQFSYIMEQHTAISKTAIEMFKTNVILGDAKRKQTETEELTRFLLTRLVLFAAQNEAKRNAELDARKNNLNTEVGNYQNIYNSQHGTITSLSNQINDLRRSGDAEIQNLIAQVNNLKVSLGV